MTTTKKASTMLATTTRIVLVLAHCDGNHYSDISDPDLRWGEVCAGGVENRWGSE
jgi:hypothetical protein